MAVGNTKGKVQLWDLESKKPRQFIDACSPIIFDDSGKYLITGNIRHRIQIWQKIVNTSHLNNKNFTNAQWWQILGVSINSSSTDVKIAYYNLGDFSKHSSLGR